MSSNGEGASVEDGSNQESSLSNNNNDLQSDQDEDDEEEAETITGDDDNYLSNKQRERREHILQLVGSQSSVPGPNLNALSVNAIGGVFSGGIDAATVMASLNQTKKRGRKRKSESLPKAEGDGGAVVAAPVLIPDPQIVSCELCGKTFKSELGMKTHAKNSSCIRRLPSKEGQPYKCAYCPRSYATKLNKDNHEKLHINPNIFDCQKCGKRFLSFSGLRRHSIYSPCE